MKEFKTALHIFRRDLRLQDNTALISALEFSGEVIPCFILDFRQIRNNPYASPNAMEFLTGSLRDLENQLKMKGSRLYFFKGYTEEILKQLITDAGVEAVFCNRDYTPFSRARDERMKAICNDHHRSFRSYSDALLIEPEQISTGKGGPYIVFSAFYRNALLHPVRRPRKNNNNNYFNGEIPGSSEVIIVDELLRYKNKNIIQKGGRKEASFLLKKLPEGKDYEETRNIPSVPGTSMLSAHNKFGTISVREVYFAMLEKSGASHGLIRELYWRDFFTHVAFHFPHVFGHSFHTKYDEIEWENDAWKFEAWRKGMTGYPIVDAGMRQLNITGWMHNRVRMIVAGFLVKDLYVDWRLGERYFAQHLIDYDPSVNNGNWQWAASTGCDAQPYFRIFNPWRQQKKFDPDCRYIKTWIPELAKYETETIHNLYLPEIKAGNYPNPIVDHSDVSKFIREVFTSLNKKVDNH